MRFKENHWLSSAKGMRTGIAAPACKIASKLWQSSLGAAASLGILMGSANSASAMPQDIAMCIQEGGVARLIRPKLPLKRSEYCEHTIAVLREGFTTTKLTFGLSATYDPMARQFSNVAAGSTNEFIRPGEHLLILDAHLDGRNLAYSLSTNSFRFVNLINIKSKLITDDELMALQVESGSPQLYMTVQAADFTIDPSVEVTNQIGAGRILAWRGNYFDETGREYVQFECLRPHACTGVNGWILKTSLSQINAVGFPSVPFPRTFEFPTRDLLKECGFGAKITSSTAIKIAIAAKAPFASSIGVELSASVDATLKAVREINYAADVKVDRTIFTIFQFRPSWLWERGAWRTENVSILILDRVTTGCDKPNPLSHFVLRTVVGSYQITEPTRNPDIKSSVAYAQFVAQAQAVTRGRIATWALSHIASALSAQRN